MIKNPVQFDNIMEKANYDGFTQNQVSTEPFRYLFPKDSFHLEGAYLPSKKDTQKCQNILNSKGLRYLLGIRSKNCSQPIFLTASSINTYSSKPFHSIPHSNLFFCHLSLHPFTHFIRGPIINEVFKVSTTLDAFMNALKKEKIQDWEEERLLTVLTFLGKRSSKIEKGEGLEHLRQK